ncbi:MAG: pantoate--beta-alanine ligase [Gammaproteobacteria bacterium]
MREAGFAPDYVRALDALTLKEVDERTREVVIAAAAYLGKARLIDNVVVALPR